MSSTYRRLCLSHSPPLWIDEEYERSVPPERPPGHPGCVIGLGRFSYPPVEVWLPVPYYDAEGHHAGQWYDVAWIMQFPELARLLAASETPPGDRGRE